MLSTAQRDEFDHRGVLRLPATIPAPDVVAMRDRVWDHLHRAHGALPNRPATWTVPTPAHFQHITATGPFNALATDELCAAVDALLGVGRWQHPEHWGRPLVTFPHPGTSWHVPTRGWHVDSHGDLDELSMLVVFAHLAPVRPRGGGTLVVTGSHLLTPPTDPTGSPVRSTALKTHLSSIDPWLRNLWNANHEPKRTNRYLGAGTVVDGIQLRVEELTGEPGDTVLMHPRLLLLSLPTLCQLRA